jgi:superfamily I DNA/RNA helicase
MSADNQQERSIIEAWILGFTDGEGCFSVSFIKNKTTKTGWQIFPEFVITQGAKSLPALEIIKDYFRCGRLFINKRYDNHREHLYRYCVRSISDLESTIVPFFSKNELKTYKKNDFQIFSEIISMMSKGIHLNKKGMEKVAKLVEKMNRKKRSQFLKSSETKRQNLNPERTRGVKIR